MKAFSLQGICAPAGVAGSDHQELLHHGLGPSPPTTCGWRFGEGSRPSLSLLFSSPIIMEISTPSSSSFSGGTPDGRFVTVCPTTVPPHSPCHRCCHAGWQEEPHRSCKGAARPLLGHQLHLQLHCSCRVEDIAKLPSQCRLQLGIDFKDRPDCWRAITALRNTRFCTITSSSRYSAAPMFARCDAEPSSRVLPNMNISTKSRPKS